MSSTNRGYERHKTDYYITPKSCIKEFFKHFSLDILFEGGGKARWLDPCSGGDEKHGMSYADAIKEEFNPQVLDTIDIRQDSRAMIKEDYLLWDKCGKEYDIIITNPPFYGAQPIITKALADVREGGYVVMLLRLNFFGSKARKKFFEKQMPVWAYVHHRRMSFTDDGKTDSIEYMHAVWQKGINPEFTKLKII